MGILSWLFGGKYDHDIVLNAEAEYERKRGPGWHWDHDRAEAAAKARANFLQGERRKGKKVTADRTGYSTGW